MSNNMTQNSKYMKISMFFFVLMIKKHANFFHLRRFDLNELFQWTNKNVPFLRSQWCADDLQHTTQYFDAFWGGISAVFDDDCLSFFDWSLVIGWIPFAMFVFALISFSVTELKLCFCNSHDRNLSQIPVNCRIFRLFFPSSNTRLPFGMCAPTSEWWTDCIIFGWQYENMRRHRR